MSPKRQSRRRAARSVPEISSATIVGPVVVTRRRRHDLQGDVVDCVRAAGRREIGTETTAATSANLFESVRRLRAQRTGCCRRDRPGARIRQLWTGKWANLFSYNESEIEKSSL